MDASSILLTFGAMVWVTVGAIALPYAAIRLRHVLNPRHKLMLATPRVYRPDGGISDNRDRLVLGVEFINQAIFDIVFEVLALTTVLDDEAPMRKSIENGRVTVPPGGRGWYDDIPIPLNTRPAARALSGRIEIHLRYGKPGRLDHDLRHRINLTVRFDDEGEIAGFDWFDVDPPRSYQKAA